MGNFASTYLSPVISTETIWPSKSRKRKISHDESSKSGRSKRLKGLSSSSYIYSQMFKEGMYSDIKIIAMDKKWNLHKVHLKQSPYFSSMLSGAWKEATQDIITINIVDPIVTVEALDLTFGSLYMDEIKVESHNVVPVLVAASHFQMDKLVDRCVKAIIGDINCNNVVQFYNIGQEYGQARITNAAFEFLLKYLIRGRQMWNALIEISVELMTKLVSHPDFEVMLTEQHVYVILIRWLYRMVVEKDEKRVPDDDIYLFFKKRTGEEFLLTEEGSKYEAPFRSLRLRGVLINYAGMQHVMEHNVIPHLWIYQVVTDLYIDLLHVNEVVDLGPTLDDANTLTERGIRYGRHIRCDNVRWKWNGFTAGLHLLWCLENRKLYVQRLTTNDLPYLINNQGTRRMLYRVSCRDVKGHKTNTDIHCTELTNSTQHLFKLPHNFTFPIYLQVEILLTSKVRNGVVAVTH